MTDQQTNRRFIVELEAGVWLSAFGGDPGRTRVEDHARRYYTRAAGVAALAQARRYRPFRDAQVRELAR